MVSNNSTWQSCKEKGNEDFKQNNYQEAINHYTQSLDLCTDVNQKSIIYRNRSACYLKLGKYNEAIGDADTVLKDLPNDVKALFRRCQAYDALGKLEPAFKDAKRLVQLEPRNKAIHDLYRKLTQQAQEKISKSHSTTGMIDEMVEALSNPSESAERRKQSLSNLAIYAHQSSGREILVKGNYLQKLIPMLSKDAESCIYLMKILHGFCESSFQQCLFTLQLVPIKTIQEYIVCYNKNIDLVTNALSVIVSMVNVLVESMKTKYKLDPKDEGKNVKIRENKVVVRDALLEIPQYKVLLNCLIDLLSNKSISAEGRDAVIDALIKVIGYHKAIADFIMSLKGILKLLELASLSCFTMLKESSVLNVNERTYIHVSVVLSEIFEQLQFYDKEKEEYILQAESVINRLIDSQNPKSNLQGLVALSTLIMATREGGQTLATKNDIVNKVLILACNQDIIYQRFSSETLALAATDKTVCSIIAGSGMDILKALYQSEDHQVRVRSLVALCKVTMKGSGNINESMMVDGGGKKLYKTCRKYLLGANKDIGLKKWACEGLAYLTIDADVKEVMVNDTEALKGLLELANSDDATVTYGICNALVNITNSFDKPEKNPELEEIAKYAKQPLPEPHEKDAEDFVKMRIHSLVKQGVITALVNFSHVRTNNTKEMMSRVFHAIVEEVQLRGKVVAQGGVKTLLYLASEGTEKGVDFASQALAKIGITNDPSLAFSGQRCMEVVRPLIKMLHFSKLPLLRFESLMALTNLASMNDSVRKRIMKEKGFQEIESLMFDDDEQLKQAATECMCNLVLNDDAFKMYTMKDSTTERLKLMVLLCGEDPPELARAAAGALAILTSDEEICKRIVEIKSYLEILKYLVTSDNIALRHRGVFIVANMIDSSREVAIRLMEDELLECLMAVKLVETNTENIKEQLDRCFSSAKKWQIIAENPAAA